jgi:hypothetical protein
MQPLKSVILPKDQPGRRAFHITALANHADKFAATTTPFGRTQTIAPKYHPELQARDQPVPKGLARNAHHADYGGNGAGST